eukprot:COSAG01_NODE_41444_length_451_cov_1.312500_1_plen_107_part_01
MSGRKRSHPATPAAVAHNKEQRTATGGAEEAAEEDEQDSAILLRCEGAAWATALRQGREDDMFIDVTLVVGVTRIRAHRIVLAGFSRYFRALLSSSGLRESQQEEVE